MRQYILPHQEVSNLLDPELHFLINEQKVWRHCLQLSPMKKKSFCLSLSLSLSPCWFLTGLLLLLIVAVLYCTLLLLITIYNLYLSVIKRFSLAVKLCTLPNTSATLFSMSSITGGKQHNISAMEDRLKPHPSTCN